MDREFENLNGKEAVKAENDFLKMKMMLEHGAHIGSGGHPDFSPEMENAWLKNVIAFEKQFEECKTIKLFNKIEKPTIFRPVTDIPDDEMEASLDSLLEWLSNYNINLEVCSPNVSPKELYRFIVEELFEYEMDDINLPGWTSNFIYDEFHPDTMYENEIAAVEDCIKMIFDGTVIQWMLHVKSGELRLNEHYPLSEDALKILINNFKKAYDEIECMQIPDVICEVMADKCTVTGNYIIKLVSGGEEQICKGKWLVGFESPDNLYWYINNVQIEGIRF